MKMTLGEFHSEKSREVRYGSDLDYVMSLIEGDREAWERFYKKNRANIENYLRNRYRELGDADIEEICDGVYNRLTKNDRKALREYRGECGFARFLITSTEWEVKDWFKRNSCKLHSESIGNNVDYIDAPEINLHEEEKRKIPEQIECLPDDLRQAFLLRYYDLFGFPADEVRILAERNGRQIREVTLLILKHFEPSGENLLTRRRKQQKAFEERLQRIFFEIHKLKIIEEKLQNKMQCLSGETTKKLKSKSVEVIEKIGTKEKQREGILKRIKLPVTTPYEVIAEILGEGNESTVRSWVLNAKRRLENVLKRK